MTRLLAIIIVLWPGGLALGWPSVPAPEPQRPHPAVVQVEAHERGAISRGSGSLVAVNATHGMVVTNFHVVRDATGPIWVYFPDGFRSRATVLKIDRDWDLAALAIAKPNVQPIPLSTQPPRPGDVLTIAGYGPEGVYRAVAGNCTQYLMPRPGLPAEQVELAAGARQGDSGGPIFNSRGELAGVLWGTSPGGGVLWSTSPDTTIGSYCGRVRVFLASATGDFQRVSGGSAMLAQSPPPYHPSPPAAIVAPASPTLGAQPVAVCEGGSCRLPPSHPPVRAVGETIAAGPSDSSPTANLPLLASPPQAAQTPPPLGTTAVSPPPPAVQPAAVVPMTPAVTAVESSMPTRAEQIKTILAAIGLLAILFHGIRLIGSAAAE